MSTATSSLSLCIGSFSRTRKRKTTFLNSKSKKNKKTKESGMKSLSRGVSLSHVVFHHNSGNKSRTEDVPKPKSTGSRGMSQADRALSVAKKSVSSLTTGKRKRVTTGSLWSKVSQNRFRSY